MLTSSLRTVAWIACWSLLLATGACSAQPQGSAQPEGADSRQAEREQMVREIELMASTTGSSTGRERLAPRVLDALRRVPRHELVPPEQRAWAYANRPLGIGNRQTISQPFIVALMTDLLDLRPEDRVLEIGTGSGYQATVLAELVDEVYTIEIVPALAERSALALERLGYGRVHTRLGDGYHGWPEAAPFDAIIVTAAAEQVPQPLLDQLAPGGRMVIPVKDGSGTEELTRINRSAVGELRTEELLPVRFVPLTGEH